MDPLKTFLVEKGWVAADASDSVVNDAAIEKIKSGELEGAKYAELVSAKAAGAKSAVADLKSDLRNDLSNDLKSMFGEFTKGLTEVLKANKPAEPAKEEPTKEVKAAPADDRIPTGNVRVKKATEAFSHTKTAVTWQKGANVGMPASITENGATRGLDTQSEAELAKCGALAKLYMKKAGADVRLTEQDINLVKEALHEDRFVGFDGSNTKRKMTDLEIKAVLDETGSSGGAYAVPEYFDNAIITIPLLSGELFPHVDLRVVNRGSSADSYTIGTPTFVSTASGSGVVPFTTTGFVSNFDTSFFPATCAFEWGLDFESDAVPDFGQQVINRIGMEAARWLDEQIAVGDGTTEPQGIFVATNTSVPASNGTGGDFVYNDALNLAFGITKAARAAFGGQHTGYVMADSTYKKFMQIVTGVTGDTRPIFGMNVKGYMLGDYPVWVQNNISEGQVCFANLKAYILYRRQGLQFLTEESGSTLRLANKKLLVARMRCGGQLAIPTTYCAEMAGDIYTP